MTPNSMPLDALLGYISSSDQDSLREILEHTLQALIEAEAAVVLGAQPHERTESRVGHRNGHRSRLLDTRVGRLELEIPKLRQGSFLPSLLEPRRRIERALWAVIQEAYVHGVSTRKVDDLVQAMGGCHVSKSEVSRICQELDVELALFRDRPLDDAVYPYVWFDATYEKVRQGGRIVSQAVVVAIGVRETGEKCVLGVAVGASETEAFWVEFCRQLVGPGAARSAVGHLRRPRGAQVRPGTVLHRGQLAALHGALPAQRNGRLLPPGRPSGAGAGEDRLRSAIATGGQPGHLPSLGVARAASPQGR